MKPLFRAFGAIFGTLRAEYRELYNRYFGTVERFPGNARAISQAVLDRLWVGDFYRTSLGHFNFFWMRDFGTVAEALVHLNQTTHVHHTLRWALRHYRKVGRVKLCIDKNGNVFNAPGLPSIDALPWLLHSIVVSQYHLNAKELAFLSHEVSRYVDTFLDENGDIKRDVRFAEMRDAVYYQRSAYAISLVGRLARCTELLGMQAFPFTPSTYRDILLREYWTGNYFRADRASQNYSSDSALMPFFLQIVEDRHLAEATLDYINEAKLNHPYPLRYSEKPTTPLRFRFGMGPWSMPNYTGDSLWTWHATFYLHILNRYDRPEYAAQYARFAELIEISGTYPELINDDVSWYKAPFYKADPGMVWAALFLALPEPSTH